MVLRIARTAQKKSPPVKLPSRDGRVKIRWTDELLARLRVEAPKTSNDMKIAERLGLPPTAAAPCGLPGVPI
jgi:hypothetical protein